MDNYFIKVYVAHGYFQYSVSNSEQALAHAQQIVSSGVYRRVNKNNEVEFYSPYKVKVCGPHLGSEYLDEFVRT
jgi:hypothetical protein